MRYLQSVSGASVKTGEIWENNQLLVKITIINWMLENTTVANASLQVELHQWLTWVHSLFTAQTCSDPVGWRLWLWPWLNRCRLVFMRSQTTFVLMEAAEFSSGQIVFLWSEKMYFRLRPQWLLITSHSALHTQGVVGLQKECFMG